jgi:hypothetical protein
MDARKGGGAVSTRADVALNERSARMSGLFETEKERARIGEGIGTDDVPRLRSSNAGWRGRSLVADDEPFGLRSSIEPGGSRMATSGTDAATARNGASSSQKVSVGRQALRREVNQRIRVLHERYESEQFEVFCECGRRGCNERVTASAAAYDALRRVPTHFLVKHSHASGEDRVVSEYDEFVVVEKFGRSGVEAVVLERVGRGG